jgi:hypothetical protein
MTLRKISLMHIVCHPLHVKKLCPDVIIDGHHPDISAKGDADFLTGKNQVGILDDLPVGLEDLGIVVRLSVELLGDGGQGVSFLDDVVPKLSD